jgi:hypothetical protein
MQIGTYIEKTMNSEVTCTIHPRVSFAMCV